MDSQGFVLLSLVAGFNRVQRLTTDLDLIKFVCYQSPNIEWRTGEDGRDRLRAHYNWQQWVVPQEERDAPAQTDGPSELRTPNPPMPQGFDGQPQSRHSLGAMPATAVTTTAPWNTMNGGMPYGAMSPVEGQAAQQFQQPQGIMMNGYGAYPGYGADMQSPVGQQQPMDAEADSFTDAQAENLTVMVKKQQEKVPNGTTEEKSGDGESEKQESRG